MSTKEEPAALAEQQPNLPAKQWSLDEMRQAVISNVKMPDDPQKLIPHVHDLVTKGKEGPVEEENRELMDKAILALGFENDYCLMETVDNKYRPMAIELRRQLIKDFDCHTYSEKVLIDDIVSGYMRHLRCAKAFNHILSQGAVTDLGSKLLGVMSKEMDRANRQKLASYQTLVSLKRPTLKVHVKAQQAFVAQNQQLNVAQPQSS